MWIILIFRAVFMLSVQTIVHLAPLFVLYMVVGLMVGLLMSCLACVYYTYSELLKSVCVICFIFYLCYIKVRATR